MPRFFMQRVLPDFSRADVDRAAEVSTQVREEQFPDITWEHTHVIRGAQGYTAYCIYEAVDAQRVRDHAAASGLPVDWIHEIETDLEPEP